METIQETQLKKRKNHAFGKDVYLLGADKEGVLYWLEMPKWECGHYWGAGYIESYTNNENPQNAGDINSHQHFKGFIIGQQKEYDFKKGCFIETKHTHHINEVLKNTTLTESESWKLSELMQSIYILKETSEFYNRGGAHITKNPLREELINESEYKRINKVLLPKLFKEVEKLLSPDGTSQEYILKDGQINTKNGGRY